MNTPIQYVKGVGPKLAALLKRKNIECIEDSLYYVPRSYEDRSTLRKISEITPSNYALVKAEIIDINYISLKNKRRKIFTITVADTTGRINLKWFNYNEAYMRKLYKVGDKVLVSGVSSIYAGRLEFYHPDLEKFTDDTYDNINFGRIVPIYSETEGLTQKTIRRIQYNIISNYSSKIEEYLSMELINRLKLPDIKESIKQVHFPGKDNSVEELINFSTSWQRRLIFDEFFIIELALALRRKGIKRRKGISYEIKKTWLDYIYSKIPFKLTKGQEKAILEIFEDMKKSEPMNRLVQGDVGSGKTIVAFIASILAIFNGYQSVMMAPTEILAEQHLKTFKNFFNDDFKAVLLTSSIAKKEKEKIKEGVKAGSIDILIGTHAVIQDDVKFFKLGFVVVDEQHRFGVEQRLKLINRGAPDILVMTATPIPRTLAMTVYGDLDFSIIRDKPAGRIPIVTRLVNNSKRNIVYDFIKEELKKDRQAYFVYPLIEESEKLLLKDAKKAAETLSLEFHPYKVMLLHGKMTQSEKESIMQDFKNKKAQILVSTTVIEVGIDVPNATVMFIEHPERFGLSQLHQLRGRIGRGDARSCCIMMLNTRVSDDSYKRLNVLVETDDGFKIAEEDLIIRGPGEFLGTKQHGELGFKLGNLIRDIEILTLARQEALRLVETDPDLKFPVNKKLREVLLTRFKNKINLMDAG